MSAVIVLTLTISKNGFLVRILEYGPLVFLGDLSYAIYMSHACILWITNQVIRVLFKKPELLVEGRFIPQLALNQTILIIFIFILTTLAISYFVFKFIETPLRKKSRIMADKLFSLS
jgi:peptidoglycan/LPS O-acetylase OafA/YrhL